MNIELNFEDFKLENIQQTEIKGGAEGGTVSDCTAGDDGCCDNSHVDDGPIIGGVGHGPITILHNGGSSQ